MGEALARLGWPRAGLRRLDQVLLGDPSRRQHDGNAEPQVPPAGDRGRRWIGSASTSSTSSTATRPTPRRRSRRPCGRCTTSSRAARRSTGARRTGRRRRSGRPSGLAERHHLHKPVVEQPQYNLLARDRVERVRSSSTSELGLGLTTWSPLALGPPDGQVPRRDSRGEPGHTARRRVVADEVDGRESQRAGQRAALGRPGARLHAGAALHRLVCQEPARLLGHHRRQRRSRSPRTWLPSTSSLS